MLKIVNKAFRALRSKPEYNSPISFKFGINRTVREEYFIHVFPYWPISGFKGYYFFNFHSFIS